MKKLFKAASLLVFMIFSFYYTEKIALYAQNKTPLKKEIIKYKQSNNIRSVDAIINGEYITPGLNGYVVNVDKSYNKMKTLNVFSEKYIVYDEVSPEVSIKDYKNKIINGGNKGKNNISIIISKNNINKEFFVNNLKQFDFYEESNYCFINKTSDCENRVKVKPTIIINNNEFLKNLNKINKGDILYLEDDLKIEYINILIKDISHKGINIVNLKEHLNENIKH